MARLIVHLSDNGVRANNRGQIPGSNLDTIGKWWGDHKTVKLQTIQHININLEENSKGCPFYFLIFWCHKVDMTKVKDPVCQILSPRENFSILEFQGGKPPLILVVFVFKIKTHLQIYNIQIYRTTGFQYRWKGHVRWPQKTNGKFWNN